MFEEFQMMNFKQGILEIKTANLATMVEANFRPTPISPKLLADRVQTFTHSPVVIINITSLNLVEFYRSKPVFNFPNSWVARASTQLKIRGYIRTL